MIRIITILTFLILAPPSSATERVNLEGDVVRYAHIEERNIKSLGFESRGGIYGYDKMRIITIPAHYFIILKSSSLIYDTRMQLTHQAQEFSPQGPIHPMSKVNLKKDEIVVLIPVSDLKELKKGSRMNLEGYSLSHFTEGLAGTLDSLTIDGQTIKAENKSQ
jgi:hypothetical protein